MDFPVSKLLMLLALVAFVVAVIVSSAGVTFGLGAVGWLGLGLALGAGAYLVS